MIANQFMPYVAERLGQKLGKLPISGMGASYNGPVRELTKESLTIGLNSIVCSEKIDGMLDFKWGVKREVSIPHLSYSSTATDLENPITSGELVGYIRRDHVQAKPDTPYSFETSDFVTVSKVEGNLPPGISSGMPLEDAIQIAIDSIKR